MDVHIYVQGNRGSAKFYVKHERGKLSFSKLKQRVSIHEQMHA